MALGLGEVPLAGPEVGLLCVLRPPPPPPSSELTLDELAKAFRQVQGTV